MDIAVSISSPHLEVTPAIKSYVEEKVARLSRHYGRHIIDMHVFLRVDNLDQKAEARLGLRHGEAVFAECIHEDLYAAIDGLADKIDRQLGKIKEQLSDH